MRLCWDSAGRKTLTMLPTVSRRSLSPQQVVYKNEICLRRAVLTGAVESQLVRSHLETLFRKLRRLDFSRGVQEDVKHPLARFTDKVLMPANQWIEMLRTAEHQDLKPFRGN